MTPSRKQAHNATLGIVSEMGIPLTIVANAVARRFHRRGSRNARPEARRDSAVFWIGSLAIIPLAAWDLLGQNQAKPLFKSGNLI
jgi:hypothetical protein